MPTQQELESAAKILASGMTPLEASVLVSASHNAYLKQQEHAKAHPMRRFSMSDADWQVMKAYLMDGGGVVDDSELAVEVLTAMLKDDQAVFWPGLIHIFKSWMKTRGLMVGAPGGGTFLRGVSGE